MSWGVPVNPDHGTGRRLGLVVLDAGTGGHACLLMRDTRPGSLAVCPVRHEQRWCITHSDGNRVSPSGLDRLSFALGGEFGFGVLDGGAPGALVRRADSGPVSVAGRGRAW